LINEAERCILEEDYIKANNSYKQAFKTESEPYAKHCFTAAQVSAVCNEFEDFIFYSRKGFKSGLIYSDFENDSILIDFIKTNKLESILKEFYKSDSLVYDESLNYHLKNEIEKLSKLDNKWKIYYLDSLSFYDSLNKKKHWRVYDSIVSEIVEKSLMPLIKKNGYPGEKLIGVERVGNGNRNSYAFVNNRAKLILLHYYSYPRDCSYNNLLQRELKKGNISPEHYASIIDFQNKYGVVDCKDYYYCEWHEPETFDKNQVDKRRQSIGLEPYDEKIKKIERGQEKCKEIRERKNYKIIKLFKWCG
jgi:hypothetical protein